jgi:hypothetical protein
LKANASFHGTLRDNAVRSLELGRYLLIFKSENGQVKIDVRFEDETVWMIQQLLSELSQTTKGN